MTKDFGKVVRLYLPSDQDIRDKQDRAEHLISPSDTGGLPLARLCPELGKVILCKGSDSGDDPQKCS